MSVENPTTIKPYFRGVKGEADGTWYSIADKPSGTDVVKIETLMICNDRFDEMVVSLAIGSTSAYWMRSKIPAQCTLHVVSAEAPLYLTNDHIYLRADMSTGEDITSEIVNVVVSGLEIIA